MDRVKLLEERNPVLGGLARACQVLAKDLPVHHRGEEQQLARIPVGNNYVETEEMLQAIFGQEFPGWRSELEWALNPPVGPKPRASWSSPPYKLDDGIATTLYIISFDIYLLDGSKDTVYKPGLTRSSVLTGGGQKGRYSQKFAPRVLFEKTGLDPRVAWTSEQKLLNCLPCLPWQRSFEDWIWYWNIYEDLLIQTNYDLFKVKELIRQEQELREGRLGVDYRRITRSKSDRLGETEWRAWRGSLPELVSTAEVIVDSCIEHVRVNCLDDN